MRYIALFKARILVLLAGLVDILPKLDIRKYKVKLGEREFFINSINNPDAIDKVMLFTPGLWTPEVSANVENWERYAPLIPIPNRVNIFVTNEGNGKIPIEKAIKIWDGQAPLPSFGAVLSFDKAYFQKIFPKTAILLGQRVKVEPVFPKNSPFSSYRQIMGGLVPAVVDKQHIYRVRTIAQLKEQLRIYGNATSPIARCGRESNNFDPRIREPAGVLIQTHNQIGWVLFDGRHELSIGASVVDVANILKILETKNVFGERIEQAVFVDGGSAMKVYTVESDGSNTRLNILNRVAAGSRNKPGIDPEGLNLYSTLQLDLQKQGE
ncbi:MAG: hypothetical protein B6I38_11805 [Anaerolineaceae bacterium 4572_5.1]|nr:MAG: hypothetical protein B6I38_11805 [Anaerolineaceae bacterium 4572_5.1]